MKTFHILAVLITAFSAALPCSAGYKPLLGSDFSERNPRFLPYTKCAITGDEFLGNPEMRFMGGWESPPIQAEGWGFIFGKTKPSRTDDLFISCISETHKLAYKIPIRIPNMITFPSIGLRLHDQFRFVFDKEGLNNKTLKDILGRYVGGGGKLSVLTRNLIRGDGFINSRGIKIHNHGSPGNGESEGSFFNVADSPVSISGFDIRHSKVNQGIAKDPYLLWSSSSAKSVSEVTDTVLTSAGSPAVRLYDGKYAIWRDKKFFTFDSEDLEENYYDKVVLEDGTVAFQMYGDVLLSYDKKGYYYQYPGRRVHFRGGREGMEYGVLDEMIFARDNADVE